MFLSKRKPLSGHEWMNTTPKVNISVVNAKVPKDFFFSLLNNTRWTKEHKLCRTCIISLFCDLILKLNEFLP
jgi:hypothetical protein